MSLRSLQVWIHFKFCKIVIAKLIFFSLEGESVFACTEGACESLETNCRRRAGAEPTDRSGHWRAGGADWPSYHGEPSSPDHGGRRPQAEDAAAPAGEVPAHGPHRSGGAGRPLPPLFLVPRRLAVRSPEIRCRDRRQVPVLGRPRRLPRQALRLLRGPRAPGVQPSLRPRGGTLPWQVTTTPHCLLLISDLSGGQVVVDECRC